MKVIKIIFSVLILIISIVYLTYLYITSFSSFLSYLIENPDKYSIVASVNNKKICLHNPDKLFPLASTKKIVILIELANQIQSGIIKNEKKISIQKIDCLYLKGLDGGAHEKWKEKLYSNPKFDKRYVSLDEVVNGMIEFSSNACTDYIMNLVTIDSVNKTVLKLGIKMPNEFLFFNSLILCDSLIMQNSNYNSLKIINKVIFDKMVDGKINITNIKPSLEFQELLISKSEKASANDFHQILETIYNNNANKLNVKYVKKHLGWLTQKKDNKKYFKYFGGKGGSLIGIYTYSCYAINNENDSINLNVFINDMDYIQWWLFQDSFIKFKNDFCKSKIKRDHILSELNLSK